MVDRPRLLRWIVGLACACAPLALTALGCENLLGLADFQYASLDTGAPDVAAIDVGAPDARVVDAGPPDALVVDSSVPGAEAASHFGCSAEAGALGLLAYWSLDEGEGGVVTSCNGGLLGHLLSTGGGPIPQWVPGYRGMALSFVAFDGGVDFVDFARPAMLSDVSKGFTVAAWVNLPPSSKYAYILGERSYDDSAPTNSNAQWALLENGGNAAFSLPVGDAACGGYELPSGSLLPPMGQWIFVAAVVDPTLGLTLYANGTSTQVMFDAGLAPVCDSNGPNLRMGAQPASDPNVHELQQLQGIVDEVYIFSRPLSSTEITDLSNQ